MAATSSQTRRSVKRIKNEDLSIFKPGYAGNRVDDRGRFVDEYDPYLPSLWQVLKWKLGGNPLKKAKKNDPWRVDVRDPHEFLSSTRDGIMWLGHSSFYIRLGGVALITDPVLGNPRFLTRLVPVPSQLDDIKHLDHILISHDHRDHMDEASLKAITAKFPSATLLAGLGSEDLLDKWKTPTNRLEQAGWFQQYELSDPNVKIYFLPTRHWARRGLLDTNRRLWGSYIIQIRDTTIFFGGDAAYSPYYAEIGELFPRIDYFIVGIGAYEPRWFMKPIHGNPADAVQALIDARAQTLIPMHYGTFDLSDEPAGQPLRDLHDAAKAAGIEDKIHPLAINEALLIGGEQ
jgi:L-ascorbate metabolism protein UlaG (beta-lactamase superfamily)